MGCDPLQMLNIAGVGLAAGAVAVAGVLAAALFKRAGRR